MIINKNSQDSNNPLTKNQNTEFDPVSHDTDKDFGKDNLEKNPLSEDREKLVDNATLNFNIKDNLTNSDTITTKQYNKHDDGFSLEGILHSENIPNPNLEMIMDIPINMQVILGSCRMQISSLMNLSEGSIITLDKRIDEPVEITVNDRKIAKGEITIIENDDAHLGIRLIEILNGN